MHLKQPKNDKFVFYILNCVVNAKKIKTLGQQIAALKGNFNSAPLESEQLVCNVKPEESEATPPSGNSLAELQEQLDNILQCIGFTE